MPPIPEQGVGQSWWKSALAELWTYFSAPLPSPATSRQRVQLHLGVAALVTTLAFVVNLLLVATTLPAVVFCVVCALKTGLTYSVSLYVMDEWVAPLVPRGWGRFATRTLGRVWVIGSTGFLLGFVVLLAQDAYLGERIAEWLGVAAHRGPAASLAPWESLLRTIPFALLTIFLVVQVRLKRQLERAFAEVVQMNNGSYAGHPHPAHDDSAPGNGFDGSLANTTYPKIVLATPTATEGVASEHISHVTIEEHYARVFVQEDGQTREVEVKLPLKKFQALLPSALFVQVHRSHLVNLAHVGRVERTGTGYQLLLGHKPHVVPISRSRAQTVLPRLHAFWESS